MRADGGGGHVHLEGAAAVARKRPAALVRHRVEAPAIATTFAAVQPGLMARLDGVAMMTPAGSVSTKLAVSVAATAFPLAIEIASFEMPPAPIVRGVNDFVTLGGWNGLTKSFAVTIAPLLPRFVTRAPAAIEFV